MRGEYYCIVAKEINDGEKKHRVVAKCGRIRITRQKESRSPKTSPLGRTTDRDCKNALHHDKKICQLIKTIDNHTRHQISR